MAEITGFIFRSTDRDVTVSFYRNIGLITHDHTHGGPLHTEVGPMTNPVVLEIYKRSSRFPVDAIMIMVESIDDVLNRLGLETYEHHPLSGHGDGYRFVYITDPEGRHVMLMETL